MPFLPYERQRPPAQGDFVDVVKGDEKGLYGVWYNTTADGKYAIVKGRDALSDTYRIPVKDLLYAEAGRR